MRAAAFSSAGLSHSRVGQPEEDIAVADTRIDRGAGGCIGAYAMWEGCDLPCLGSKVLERAVVLVE
jgi:hypothetical protein